MMCNVLMYSMHSYTPANDGNFYLHTMYIGGTFLQINDNNTFLRERASPWRILLQKGDESARYLEAQVHTYHLEQS